ncbi:MAG: serine/threonine protein kinase, partial [Labilithrix sp.]|nr:serine/threonine protein kinase [Labilithrix sp.]
MGSKPHNDEDAWVPQAGAIIAGRYRVERGIGSGGMGAVVSAVHLALGERVALKLLNPVHATTTGAIERFVREARAATRIKSEHVVRVTDVGATDSGVPFIAMELLEGEDLASLVSRGSLPLTLAVDCILHAAEALSEAHAAGVIHRDIKPSNLWMTLRG